MFLTNKKMKGRSSRFLGSVCLMLAFCAVDRGQKPELVVQTGHSSPIESIVSSPDGKVLASVDRDGLVIIWDVSTGHELRAFSVPSSWSGSVAFSADSKTIAYGYSLGIQLWDVSSGREAHYFEGSSTSVAFSSNGEAIISVNTEGEAVVWYIKSGKRHLLQEGLCYVSGGTGAAPIYVQHSLAVAPDGKSTAVLTCDPDTFGLVLLDVETGHRLKSFEDSNPDDSYPLRYGALAFSRDGEMLIGSRESQPQRIFLRQEKDGNMVPPLEVGPHHLPDKTRVWSVATGKVYASFPGISPRLSQDGKYLTTQDEGTITLWDLASRQMIRTFTGQSAAFLFDHRTVAVADSNSIALFEIASGNKVKGFAPAGATSIHAIDISPDGQMIVIGTNKSIKLWKLASDSGLISLEEFKNNSDSDGNTPVTGDSQLANLNSKPFLSVSFSPNNRVIAAAHNRYVKVQEGFDVHSTLLLWEQAFGKIRKKITVDTFGLIEYFVPEVRSVKFSPNGELVATLQGNKSIKLLDLYSHKIIRVAPIEGFTPTADRINTMLFSPDGRVLGYGDGWGVALVDTKTGRRRYLGGHPLEMDASEAKENGPDFMGLTLSIVFSPDGKIIGGAFSKHYEEEWVGDERDVGFYKFWNVSTGREMKFSHLPAWAKFSYKLSKPASINGRDVRVVVERNQIKLINLRTKELILTLVAFDISDWLVVTPDGLFDGTPGAWKKILWRFNNNIFDHAPAEVFFNEFYYPGLLTDIFADKQPKAPSDISQKDRRQPQLKLALVDAGLNTTVTDSARKATVNIEVSESPVDKDHKAGSGARDVRLFRNGSLVKLWSGDLFGLREKDGCKLQPQATSQSPRRSVCTATVPIVAGPNNFTAYAFNQDNIKSEDATLTVTGAVSLKRKGTLHIMAIGVSKYSNKEYNLNYTTDDAASLASQLKLQQEKLGRFETANVKTLLNEEATKANILAELKRLSTVVQPEDAVVVYFSGHGKAEGDHFYLVPHDLGYSGPRDKLSPEGLQQVLKHSISEVELEEAFRGIDAGQMFMIIDACNSGQALENKDEPRRGPMNTRGLAQLAYEKGMYILTASQNVEEAFVSEKLKHSYLTYALVEDGLKTNAADADHNGEVTLREWFDYAVVRVPKLREATLQSKSLDQIDPNTVKSARSPKSQMPRVFYRREPEMRPLIVASARESK